MDDKTLATELLHELKASGQRWFYAFIIVLVLWFGTIAAFLWYISLPVEETSDEITQDLSDVDSSTVIGIGDYNGETNGETN